MGGLIGMRRWETYVALLAVILASLAPMADNPRTTLFMALGAIVLIVLVAVALLSRSKSKKKPESFDPYARAARIREEREKRTRRS